MENPWKTLSRYTSDMENISEDSDNSSHPFNILLQIFLPVVLILTFILLIRMNALEIRTEEIQKTQKKMISDERGKTADRLVESLLKLQLQKLLRALEQVKREKRIQWHIDVFQMQDIPINIVNDRLTDERLKAACRKTYQSLGTVPIRKKEADSIYARVLDYAGIEDHGFEDLENPNVVFIDENRERIITNDNRLLIRSHIADFLDNQMIEVRNLQESCIDMILDFYISANSPVFDTVETLKKLSIIFDNEKSEDNARNLYRGLIDYLEVNLKQQEYQFLDDTWIHLKQSYESEDSSEKAPH